MSVKAMSGKCRPYLRKKTLDKLEEYEKQEKEIKEC